MRSVMSNNKNLTIFGDGGSRGNPGEAAYGFVVSRDGKVIYEEGKRIGVNTNNVAEYSAVIEALRYLDKNKKLEFDSVHFFLDSMLVVHQMNGMWKVKNENLREMIYTAKTLERKLEKKITYKHVPREKNKEADRMVNLALDNLV